MSGEKVPVEKVEGSFSAKFLRIKVKDEVMGQFSKKRMAQGEQSH